MFTNTNECTSRCFHVKIWHFSQHLLPSVWTNFVHVNVYVFLQMHTFKKNILNKNLFFLWCFSDFVFSLLTMMLQWLVLTVLFYTVLKDFYLKFDSLAFNLHIFLRESSEKFYYFINGHDVIVIVLMSISRHCSV